MVPDLDADTVTQPRGRAWSGCSVALNPALAAESEHVTNVPQCCQEVGTVELAAVWKVDSIHWATTLPPVSTVSDSLHRLCRKNPSATSHWQG
jgi:hypothetical protein